MIVKRVVLLILLLALPLIVSPALAQMAYVVQGIDSAPVEGFDLSTLLNNLSVVTLASAGLFVVWRQYIKEGQASRDHMQREIKWLRSLLALREPTSDGQKQVLDWLNNLDEGGV